MIPIIGFMIGMYILTRMIEIGSRKESSGCVCFFTTITFLATICFMIALMVKSTGVRNMIVSLGSL